MTLKFTNVVVDVLNKNKTHSNKYLRLVNNITGELKYNTLTAIMGPSGCGKSTFLAALVGRIQTGSKTSGEITIDGEPREYRSFIKRIGILEQDDDVFPTLTLKETLSYAIKFRLSKLHKGREEYIDEMVDSFGLKHVKLNHMCKLSGGERKRAMLAIELITDAGILFADEPTSGLDTKTALRIMKLLKREAEKGKMVVVCIHQPSIEIYSLFDTLMLMTEAQVVYFGPAADFEQFLAGKGVTKRENISFPDFIAEMVVKGNDNDDVNPNYALVKELIDERYSKNQDQANIVSCNESVHDFRINLKHIWLVQSRQWKIAAQSKYKLLKSFLKSALGFIISMFVCKMIYNAFIEESQIIKKNIELTNPIGIDLALHGESIYIVYLVLTLLHLVFILTGNITAALSAFFDSSNIIKREIANGSYSSTSYVLGLFVFYYVKNVILLAPLTAIFLFVYHNKITYTAIAGHLASPLISIPTGFAFGSISQNKKITLAISSFLVIPLLIVPCCIFIIYLITAATTITTLKYILLVIESVLFFAPTYYFMALFMLTLRKYFSQLDKISASSLPDNVRSCYEIFDSFINGAVLQLGSFFYMNIYSMISIFIGSTILVFLFVMIRQSNFLMPAIRMKLSK